jgi:hypothetical protein
MSSSITNVMEANSADDAYDYSGFMDDNKTRMSAREEVRGRVYVATLSQNKKTRVHFLVDL